MIIKKNIAVADSLVDHYRQLLGTLRRKNLMHAKFIDALEVNITKQALLILLGTEAEENGK